MTHKPGTPMCHSDNIALRPTVKSHLINPLAGYYIPARDNPPAPVRPGAEDNKLHKSLPAQGHATYHRGHV